jgi:hypothetical protein
MRLTSNGAAGSGKSCGRSAAQSSLALLPPALRLAVKACSN